MHLGASRWGHREKSKNGVDVRRGISVAGIAKLLAFYVLCLAFPSISAAEKEYQHQVLEVIENLNTGNREEDETNIRWVSHYPSRDVSKALYRRIFQEIDAMEERFKSRRNVVDEFRADLKPDILFLLLASLGNMPSPIDKERLQGVTGMLEEIFKASPDFKVIVDGLVAEQLKKVKDLTVDLPSIAELLAARPNSPNLLPSLLETKNTAEGEGPVDLANHRYSQIQLALSEGEFRIIGQPEIVDYFAAREFRLALLGSVEKTPETMMMMGLSGTGKDTSIENYLGAKHGSVDAVAKHLFRVPVLRSKEDLWKAKGSNTGYIGSESMPPLYQFLVAHSAGKYKIQEKDEGQGKKSYFIELNPVWREGEAPPPGYFWPSDGILFLNEFHDWGFETKNAFKEALEKRIFDINNPNGGVAQIQLDIPIAIATNDGIRLVASREANGERFGRPLSYEEMLQKWEDVAHDSVALKNELMRSNGKANSSQRNSGYSEEFLNRVQRIFLMRPLPEEGIREIANIELQKNLSKYRKKNPEQKTVDLAITWSPQVVEFLQSYKFIAEDNARPIKFKAEDLIERTLVDALREGKIPNRFETTYIELDVVSNEDRTKSLRILSKDSTGQISQDVLQQIRTTLSDKEKKVISDDEIDRLLKFPEYLRRRVFGLDSRLVERLSSMILLSEEASHGSSTDPMDNKEPANIMGFLGLSSSGKTQTAKTVGEFIFNDSKAVVSLDFSSVQTMRDLEEKILGLRDEHGNAIPSDFMKHYDRRNGRGVVFTLDEIANAPLWVLRGLYEIFREPVVRTFSDGKPRSMGHVYLMLTGNAGEELYSRIPKSLPDLVRMLAMEEAYNIFQSQPHLRREILEKYFSPATIARIGESNIFFFPPATFRSLRELSQLKFMEALDELKAKNGRRGWNLAFGSADDFLEILEVIEEEGFVLDNQGASIDQFVRQDLARKIRATLLVSKIPSGSTLQLRRNKSADVILKRSGEKFNSLGFELQTESGEIVSFYIDGKRIRHQPKVSDQDKALTAVHEIGHDFTRRALFGSAYKPKRLSIIAGYAFIESEGVYYSGISEALETKDLRWGYEVVIREIAVFMGGYVSERLVTKERLDDAGKANDIQRATSLAQKAILAWGLSERWGMSALPRDMTLQGYISGLSETQKEKLEQEVQRMLKEGEALAENVLAPHMKKLIIPMAMELLSKGVFDEDDFTDLYERYPLPEPSRVQGFISRVGGRIQRLFSPSMLFRNRGLDAELIDEIRIPNIVADIEKLAQESKAKQVAEVALPENLPLISSAALKAKGVLGKQPLGSGAALPQGGSLCASHLKR